MRRRPASPANELTLVVGRHCDLKARRTDHEARFLVEHYNYAVERANRMRGAS